MILMASQRGRGGLALLELLVVGAAFSLILAALFSSLVVGRNAYLSAEALVQVQEESRRAFQVVTQELRKAGNVNRPGAQRLDFQIARDYDTACGGICWGTESGVLPNGWIHYVVDAAGARLMRCLSANRDDLMPANFAGCRVLANNVSAALADTAFTYDPTTRVVTVNLQTVITSPQLPSGSMRLAPGTLSARVRLRNP